MDPSDVDQQLAGLAGLGDPLRRVLYRYVAERGVPISRDEAAHAAGISRPLAAYHLDKLVDDGLLEPRYHRRGGRRGPGAGRPAKHYVRADRPIELSLPARDYAALAELLAGAVEADPSGAAKAALATAPPPPSARSSAPRRPATPRPTVTPTRSLPRSARRWPPAATSPTRTPTAPSGCATAPSTASPPSTASWSAEPTTPCSKPSPTTSVTRRPSERCWTHSPDAAASP
jgi:DNA-binding transcriptional ArsR family regulator